MELKTVKYDRKYRTDCIELMGDTWNLNTYFKGLKKTNLVNELYFDGCLLDENYSEVIIDEEDRVHGYLIGKTEGGKGNFLKSAGRKLVLILKGLYHLTAGNFGSRSDAVRLLRELGKLSERLDRNRKEFGGYVNVFFISSSLRGMGWGRKLMDHFTEYCRANGNNGVYLWTDLGCNYGFYDHYGFVQSDRIHSPLLDNPENEYNGFVYTLRF